MALPPAFSIASCAVLENLCAWMVTGPASLPLLSTLMRPPFLRSRPSSTILSSVNSVPGAVARISATRSRPSSVYSTRKILLKPRFGRRRCSGIWPPSKPRISEEPEREPWPLVPRVAVLPMPEPMPRPTRFLFSFAFLGARRLERLRIAISCFLAITPAARKPADSHVLQAFPAEDGYSTTRTRCGTLATMPRIDGVSSRSTIWLRRVKPRPLTTSLCLTGVQIFERKYCSLILPLAVSFAMVKLLMKIELWFRSERQSLQLFHRFAAQRGDFGLVAKLDECIEGGLDHVVRVG